MKTIPLAEAKMHLSRYVDSVRHGERVRIAVRGVPVAELAPIPAATVSDDDALLARLERAGIVRRGKGGVPGQILEPGPRSRGRPASTIVMEERKRR